MTATTTPDLSRDDLWHDGYDLARAAARSLDDARLDALSREADAAAHRTGWSFYRGTAAAFHDERQDRNLAVAKAKGLVR